MVKKYIIGFIVAALYTVHIFLIVIGREILRGGQEIPFYRSTISIAILTTVSLMLTLFMIYLLAKRGVNIRTLTISGSCLVVSIIFMFTSAHYVTITGWKVSKAQCDSCCTSSFLTERVYLYPLKEVEVVHGDSAYCWSQIRNLVHPDRVIFRNHRFEDIPICTKTDNLFTREYLITDKESFAVYRGMGLFFNLPEDTLCKK